MIIIKFIGGLGNQMFQYALYRKLKESGKVVKADLTEIKEYNRHNGYEIENVFNVKIDEASIEELSNLKDNRQDIISKIRRKLFGFKKSHYIEKSNAYDENILNLDNIYLDGYWQTSKYFDSIRDVIFQDFNYNFTCDNKNEEVIKLMKESNSVSMHIRRGDYVSNPEAAKVHGGITTLQYYQNAIKYINANIEKPMFFIFSDDVEWTKKNIVVDNSMIISWNRSTDSFKDMILMSNCKHNIIANSSFSWWGAYLNKNKDKKVLAPNKWYNTMEAPDIICDNWITIKVD